MKLTGLITVEKIREAINSLYDNLPSIATQAEAEAGTDNTKMMTPLRTKQAIGKLVITVPVGTGIDFYADNPPEGFLVRNGAAVNRTTYAALFAVIGTKYGAGDGSTTFNLPNSIGKFSQGDSVAGTEKAAGLPNITGSYKSYRADYGTVTYAYDGAFNQTESTEVIDHLVCEGNDFRHTKITFDASRSSAVYGNSTTVQPPALTVLPCIKY